MAEAIVSGWSSGVKFLFLRILISLHFSSAASRSPGSVFWKRSASAKPRGREAPGCGAVIEQSRATDPA